MASDENALRTTLASIIKTPAKFEGKIVSVEGYPDLEFEGFALYESAQALKASESEKALWLELNKKDHLRKERDKKLVHIRGRFTSKRKGHFDMWPGALEEVVFESK